MLQKLKLSLLLVVIILIGTLSFQNVDLLAAKRSLDDGKMTINNTILNSNSVTSEAGFASAKLNANDFFFRRDSFEQQQCQQSQRFSQNTQLTRRQLFTNQWTSKPDLLVQQTKGRLFQAQESIAAANSKRHQQTNSLRKLKYALLMMMALFFISIGCWLGKHKQMVRRLFKR